MSAFLLTSIPLALLALLSFAASQQRSGRRARTDPGWLLVQALAGAITFVVALLILRALGNDSALSFRPAPLYAHVLVREHGLYWLVAACGYAVTFLLLPVIRRRPAGIEGFAGSAAFLAGFFALVQVTEYLAGRGELTAHDLFLLPVVRTVQLAAASCCLALLRPGGVGRWFPPVLVLLALPALGSLEGALALSQRPGFAASVATALIVAGGAWVYANRAKLTAADR